MTRDLRPLSDSVAVVGASSDPAKWGHWLAQGALKARPPPRPPRQQRRRRDRERARAPVPDAGGVALGIGTDVELELALADMQTINPLLVTSGGAVLPDARLVLARDGTSSAPDLAESRSRN